MSRDNKILLTVVVCAFILAVFLSYLDFWKASNSKTVSKGALIPFVRKEEIIVNYKEVILDGEEDLTELSDAIFNINKSVFESSPAVSELAKTK